MITRYKVEEPNEKQIISDITFIANDIVPITIKPIGSGIFNILFYSQEDNSENVKYFVLMLGTDTVVDGKFLMEHPLNFNNLGKNPQRIKMYEEFTEKLNNSNMYKTDLDMYPSEEEGSKSYFYTYGYNVLDNGTDIERIKIMISKENFIKINVFLIRLFSLDITADSVFVSKKYHNIEFVKVRTIKLDATTTDLTSNFIMNHYTATTGPIRYKMSFISPKDPNAKTRLRNPLLPDVYNAVYENDFIVNEIKSRK